MLAEIVRFELVRHFRAISTYVYFLLFGALACLLMLAAGGEFEDSSISFGAGGKVLANSPYALAQCISILGYFGLLVIAAITGRAAFQDFDHKTDSFFFTSQAGKTAYLGGRYLAAVLILVFIFSSLGLGLFAGSLAPDLDHERMGPNRAAAYLAPYLISVIPNVIVMGALFFSLAALARRIFPVYVTSVVLLMGYLIAGTISRKIEHKFLASLADPFGASAMGFLTEYWTISEKNTRLVPLAGYLLWNRVLWLGIAAALLGFTWWKFRMQWDRPSGLSTAAVRRTTLSYTTHVGGPVLLTLTWLAFVETIKNIYFTLIVLAGILYMVVSAREMGDWFGTPTYPVTYQVIDMASGSFALFMLIVITFYSGELAWRERDAGTHEIVDAMPLPGWAQFLSKLLALLLVPILLQGVVMLTGMAIQLAKGYTRLEPLLYVKDLFGLQLVEFWLVCVLAMAVHSVVNNKYLGHFIMVLFYVITNTMGKFGLEHRLYNYASIPDHTYSDMNRFGPFLRPVFWFSAYWAVCAVLVAMVACLFWVRGLAVDWRWRLRLARGRFRAPQWRIAVSAGAAFLALGGFIFYNTNILHHYRTTYQSEDLTARYEKEYKKYLKTPQPKIAAVNLRVDLDPSRADARARIHGSYAIANRNAQPVQRILVTIPEECRIHRMAFTPAASLEWQDRKVGVQMYSLAQPLAPGETGTLEFEIEYAPRGFSNGDPDTNVVENGTFFDGDLLPHFGYNPDGELADDDTRRKHGLPPKPRMADINDLAARQINDTSRDADWVTFETVIATAPDQIAIAPGELVREWTEGKRRLFQYRSRGKALNFLSVLSARYRVLRDRWNDVDVAIYYHPGHEYNLAAMMKGMKQTLEYGTKNFGPYQNKTVRIVEFPRYESFAQSFLASIPYSESIGFIARVDPTNEEDIDYPFYVTAHEVAHQWWGHQAVGANVQGASMISESLAEYTAMMVMKLEFGPEKMRRFLKYDMDKYLAGRSSEKKKELPLVRVENQQYIHYEKGSVVFYCLQDYIGERNVNRALRDYLKQVAFQEPPYTTALELEASLRQVTPPEYSYLIDDMLDSITLYENRALSATYRELSQGKYEVKLKVAARKLKADELGQEKEVPLADWIDIGVFDEADKPLYMTRHKIVQKETEFTLVVDRVPKKAGIDPWNKLVDRAPDDNVTTVSKL